MIKPPETTQMSDDILYLMKTDLEESIDFSRASL
jgi:hypothetical protein